MKKLILNAPIKVLLHFNMFQYIDIMYMNVCVCFPILIITVQLLKHSLKLNKNSILGKRRG